MEEDTMKKLAYVIAAITAVAIAAPSAANAEKIIIKRDGHHHMDRGWHRDHGWHHHDHDRVVIKHRY
jgi:Ni/Co efflux regulator RcnB